MKHLLIILSILLLSSPVIGDNHKGETLYLWETSSGEVWKGFGEKGTHPKYKGDVKNGKPNGVGILIHPNGDKYVGEWKDGERHGQGTFTYSKGEKYVGGWKDGKRNGKGTYTSTDGYKYLGEFKDDKWDGQGSFILPDGRKVVGEFRNDKHWNVTEFDKNGNINGKFVNGEWIIQ